MNRSIEETERQKSISPDDFRKILELAKEKPWERFLLFFIGNLGLRVGEAVRVRLDGIDLENKVLKIPKIKITGRRISKRGTSGLYDSFPINDSVVKAIAIYLKEHPWIMSQEWLFPGTRNGFLSTNRAQNIFYKYARRLGINASIHSLRHMQGYVTYKKTSDIRAVQIMLRHKSMETSTIYSEPTLDIKRDIREFIGTISDDPKEESTGGKMEDWVGSPQSKNLKRGFEFREELRKSRIKGIKERHH